MRLSQRLLRAGGRAPPALYAALRRLAGSHAAGRGFAAAHAAVAGLAPEIPEDLYHLIKKAVSVRKHLERNRKDKDSKFRLILVESRIHRLARYYKRAKKLPPTWKYESSTASAMVA